MRLLLLISGWTAAVQAILSLIRLGFSEWPVVMTYQRWEYVVRVVEGAGWAAVCFLAIYVWAK